MRIFMILALSFSLLTPSAPASLAQKRAERLPSVLICIRHAESRDDYRAVSRSGKYRGAFQFAQSTWNSVSNRRLDGVRPDRASRSDQDGRAVRLYQLRGTRPWSTAGLCR